MCPGKPPEEIESSTETTEGMEEHHSFFSRSPFRGGFFGGGGFGAGSDGGVNGGSGSSHGQGEDLLAQEFGGMFQQFEGMMRQFDSMFGGRMGIPPGGWHEGQHHSGPWARHGGQHKEQQSRRWPPPPAATPQPRQQPRAEVRVDEI